MWILPLLAAALTTPTAPSVSLPPKIKTTLNQEYAGWKLAPVSKAVQAEFVRLKATKLPSLTTADFNKDGKLDYAVQIAMTTIGQEEQIIMVFMALPEGGYAENIVQSMGLDPNSYLWIQTKALPTTGSDAQEKLVNVTLLRVLGGPAGNSAYRYDTDHFAEVPLKEDLNAPDSSLPQVAPPL